MNSLICCCDFEVPLVVQLEELKVSIIDQLRSFSTLWSNILYTIVLNTIAWAYKWLFSMHSLIVDSRTRFKLVRMYISKDQ